MNLRLYDSDTITTDLWRQLSSFSSLQLDVFLRWGGVQEIPKTPQLIIVDQSAFGDSLSFAAEVLQLCTSHPQHLVVVTGGQLSVGLVVKLMSNGVASVIEKPLTREQLSLALPSLIQAAQTLEKSNREFERLTELFSSLTGRETHVLDYVLAGVSNKATAKELNVSVRTVESRRAKLYRKLESTHVADLVRKMDRLEILRNYFQSGAELETDAGHPPPPKMHLNRTAFLRASQGATPQLSQRGLRCDDPV